MQGRAQKIAAALGATLIALQLGGCGGGSGTAESDTTAPSESAAPASGAPPSAWNNVSPPIRNDILAFGEEGTQGEIERAAVVLRGYLGSRIAGNYSKACSYLSDYMLVVVKKAGIRRGGHGCVGGLESLEELSSVDEIEGQLEIIPTKIRHGSKGKRNFLFYEDGYGDTFAMLMRHEGGTWKIQAFEPNRLS